MGCYSSAQMQGITRLGLSPAIQALACEAKRRSSPAINLAINACKRLDERPVTNACTGWDKRVYQWRRTRVHAERDKHVYQRQQTRVHAETNAFACIEFDPQNAAGMYAATCVFVISILFLWDRATFYVWPKFKGSGELYSTAQPHSQQLYVCNSTTALRQVVYSQPLEPSSPSESDAEVW